MDKNTKVVISLDGPRGKTLDVRGDLGLLRELVDAFGPLREKQVSVERSQSEPKPKLEPAHAGAD